MRYTLVSCLLAATTLVGAASAELRVVTTTADLAALARAVSGDAVDVRAIARGTQDPHYLDARPSYMRTLNRADLLVYNGLELEIGWLPLLVEGSRNPRVLAGRPGSLGAAAGIDVLEKPAGQIDRSAGDIHPEGNPHYTLDPRNGLLIANAIAARLAQLQPENAAAFETGQQAFATALAARLAAWQPRVQALRGTPVVAHHKQWEYLAAWLGLDIVGYLENKPGIPPSPRHVTELVEHMRTRSVAIVMHSTFVDPRAAEGLAARAGARAVELPASTGAVDGVDDYLDLFDEILRRLEAGIGEGGDE